MRNRYCLFFVLVLNIVVFGSCLGQSNLWEAIENEDGVLIKEGVDSILFYQRKPKSRNGQFERSNYIHPLYGISGNVLTEDFPEDHLHHRGIFWTWHQNYVGSKSVGDAWALENFIWEVTDVTTSTSNNSAILQTKVNWKSPLWLRDKGSMKAFAREEAKIEIFPKVDNYRVIDFEIELTALEDSLFIGGSEDEKGYSGFSWRIKLPEDVVFKGQSGAVEPTRLSLEAGSWMNIAGSLASNRKEGIVVVSDASNPNHPQPWILRKKRSMQNAVFPGRDRVLIPKKEPLKLKYRMIVYSEKLSSGMINELSEF